MFRTLAQKGTLASLACLMLLTVAATYATASIFALRDSAAHLAETTLPQIAAIGDFNIALTRAIGEAKVYGLKGDESEFEEAQEALAAAQTALTALDPNKVEQNTASSQVADGYMRLYGQQQILLKSTQQLIESMPTADSDQRTRILFALEELEGGLDELGQEADVIQAQDTTIVTTAVALRLQTSLASIGVVLGLSLLLPIVALYLLRRSIIQPIQGLSVATAAIIGGRLEQIVRVTSNDEIGLLQRNFNTMTATIERQTRHLEQEISTANAARTEAETARAALAAQLATVEEQRAVIREMSVPILPLAATTLVMPLVGALDTQRLQLLQDQALRAIEQTPTHYLILDITGVPILDTQVAQGLFQVVQMARLLGTEVMLVGIRPEVAQSLVGLGLRLDQIITRSTLQAGIHYTLQYQ